MQPRVFGLAEIDEQTGEGDPERVVIWGLESDDGAVMHWREGPERKSQFSLSESAESAEALFGRLFGLALVWV